MLHKVARRNIRSLMASTDGTAAVEMAIVFPVFMLISFGILAFGIYFGAAHSTQELAAAAARSSVAGLDDAERAQLADDYVKANVASYPLLAGTKVKTSSGSNEKSPDDFVVSVSFDAADLPIWSFAAVANLTQKTITRTSVVRRGGVQ